MIPLYIAATAMIASAVWRYRQRDMLGIAMAFLAISMVVSSGADASDKTCSRAAKVAERLMNARQLGVSLEDALDALVSSYPASAHKYVRKLVMDAYSIPRFSSTEYQQRAIAEFRDGAHLACLKAQ